MSSWRPSRNDLVLPRLLAEATDLRVLSEASDLAAELRRNAMDQPAVVHSMIQQGEAAMTSLLERLGEYEELITGGVSSIVALHVDPAREVHTPGGPIVLLKPLRVDDETLVITSTWEVEKHSAVKPVDRRFISLDEFHVARELVRLERLLSDWAMGLRFVPEHPTVRVICVVAPEAAEALPEVEERLRATAAVWGAELDFLVAPQDPRDTSARTKLERAALSNRYRLMLSLSDVRSKWVWKLGRRFAEAKRAHRALPLTSAEDAVGEFASVIAATVKALPDRPTEYWGPDALSRVDQRVGTSFDLTARARGHLAKNRYPLPERMLAHVERLADVAEAWSERKAAGDDSDDRLEDWAYSAFGLRIALHDKGIREKDAYFDFDGLRLSNRPHVKVDDYTSASECGRIYFGIDERPDDKVWRFVVDHIGLHDRS